MRVWSFFYVNLVKRIFLRQASIGIKSDFQKKENIKCRKKNFEKI